MLIDLKVWSLACKCIFYRLEHNAKGEPMKLNFQGLEILKWNIPSDRFLREDKKNGVICLAFMFTLRVMVIKMSKMAYFFADDRNSIRPIRCFWIFCPSCD